MTSAEKQAEDDAIRAASAKHEAETVVAARALAVTMGVGDLYVGPKDQPLSTNADWDVWRATPQTRRLMSWFIETIVRSERRIEKLTKDMALAVSGGRIHEVSGIALESKVARTEGDACRDAVTAIIQSYGNASTDVKLSPEAEGRCAEAMRRWKETTNAEIVAALERVAKQAA
jgi:hypothetical protein